MKYNIGREPIVVHTKYGDGLLLETFIIKGNKWYRVKCGENLIIETPSSEWVWKYKLDNTE